jgi:hypothetical protein
MNKLLLFSLLLTLANTANAENITSQSGRIGREYIKESADEITQVYHVEYFSGFESDRKKASNSYVQAAKGLAEMCVLEEEFAKNTYKNSYTKAVLVKYTIDNLKVTEQGVRTIGSCHYKLFSN